MAVKRNLRDKVVVITGASHGFGRSAAIRFAGEGCSVALAARSGLEEIKIECESAGGRALVVPTDVRQDHQVEHLLNAALEAFGRVDVWVNNAGTAATGEFERVSLDLHKDVLQTNLLGTFYGCFFAIREFRKNAGGTIINIASPPAKMLASFLVSYATAKAGVIGLGEALRQELRSEGETRIHVCTVMPTAVAPPPDSRVEPRSGDGVPLVEVAVADRVVDAVLDVAMHPKDEVTVETPRYFA